MRKSLLVLSLSALAAVSFAASGSMTADNHFRAYLSTSETDLGNLILSGDDWTQVYTVSGALADGQDYFLHVVGINDGGPASFVGSFSLDATHQFANGTTSLDTNTTDWTVSLLDYTDPGYLASRIAPTSFGLNGVGPWGLRSGISANADNIWTANQEGTVYFSTKIQAVPEPASMAALGLGALGVLRRRKKS